MFNLTQTDMDKKALQVYKDYIKGEMKNDKYISLPQIYTWCINGSKFAIGFRLNGTNHYLYDNLSRDYAIYLREELGNELTKILKVIADNTKSRGGKWIVNTDKCNTPTSMALEPKPCKEFKSLQKWLTKYANFNLKENSIYCVSLFGKRSTYDESGRRKFIDTHSKECANLLEQLRKLRKSGDKLVGAYKTHDDIDTKTSSYYETECYGTRYVNADIVVTSPKGKNKGTITIACW